MALVQRRECALTRCCGGPCGCAMAQMSWVRLSNSVDRKDLYIVAPAPLQALQRDVPSFGCRTLLVPLPVITRLPRAVTRDDDGECECAEQIECDE